MELVEGETLEHRLQKGPLPTEQTIRYAAQIAEALAKAHKLGITHRDLKPSNIMLTNSGAKLMDFGLAKHSGGALAEAALNEMTMDEARLTGKGTIVGTFQYMAPEQLEGKEADARTDIFALGEVIYEMTTAKPAFSGQSRASLIAAILTADPPSLRQLQPMTPTTLEHVVRKCLAKDPEERWQSASDLASELKWSAESSSSAIAAEAPPRQTNWGRRGVLVAAGVLAMAAAFVFGTRLHRDTPTIAQFEVNPPPKTYFNFRGLSGPPAPSPDGKKLAFVAFTQGKAGSLGLWLRSLDSSEARFLPGTEGAVYPFWSPDSRFLAFFMAGKLRKLDLASGSSIPICDVSEGRGGAWSTDGVILFGNRTDGLFRVAASGGKPVRLTTLDENRHETSHRFPQFLPDQKHFLFVGQAPQIPSANFFVASLDSPKPVLLEGVNSRAMFSGGYLLYTQDTSLLARPFDPGRLQFTGEPISLAEHIQSDPQFNYSAFSVSQTLLAYQAGAVTAGTRLTSYDRSGKGNLLRDEQELIQTIALSPGEDRLAIAIGLSSGQLTDIWIYDLRTNSKAKLTFDQHSYAPAWWPDGTRIVFDRVTSESDELVAKDVSSGAEEILFKVARQGSIGPGSSTPQRLFPVAWSSDGRLLIYRTAQGAISALPLKGERKPAELFDTKTGIGGAALSPDGKWLAYASTETGIPETYVVALRISPDGSPSTSGGKWQVSDGGGTQPFWRSDGKELFFVNSSLNTFMYSAVNFSGDHFHSEKPQYLFDLDAHPVTGFYAVTRDGKKIYMVTYGPGSTAPITATTNWRSLLKK
jgi:Tol biopolymer transport system component